MKRIFGLIVSICFITAISWAIPVEVFFSPSSSVVEVEDTFAVNLLADIPDSVLGWGLDVNFDSKILSLEDVTVGSLWPTPTSNPDGDGLIGLAFPSTVSGDNILLAILEFKALSLGTSSLEMCFTPTNLTEGFPLAPPALPGSFAEVNFIDGSVNVVPEPSTMLLLVSGLIGLAGFSRKKFKSKHP